MEPVSIKVRFGNEIRRGSLRDAGFKGLLEVVARMFGLPEAELRVRYTDDEGDLIALSSDAELEEALRLARLSGNVLHLNAIRVDSNGVEQKEPSVFKVELGHIDLAKKTQELKEGLDLSAQNVQEEITKTTQELKEGFDKTTQELKEGFDKTKENLAKKTQEFKEGFDKTTHELKEGLDKTKENLKEEFGEEQQLVTQKLWEIYCTTKDWVTTQKKNWSEWVQEQRQKQREKELAEEEERELQEQIRQIQLLEEQERQQQQQQPSQPAQVDSQAPPPPVQTSEVQPEVQAPQPEVQPPQPEVQPPQPEVQPSLVTPPTQAQPPQEQPPQVNPDPREEEAEAGLLDELAQKLAVLEGMGFTNRVLNVHLLKKHQGSLQDTIDELLACM